MAIGELDIHRHAHGNGGCRPQRTSGSVTHQREAARQHAAIGECREQLRVALAPRPARIEQVVHGTAGPFGEGGNAFPVAREPHPMRRNIGARARTQPQRQSPIALTPAFDLTAQQVSAQASTDARQTDTMDMRIGAQRPA